MNEAATAEASDLLRKYARPSLSGVSKYAQLRETLVAAIRGGHWAPGHQLPAERVLASMTGFSLGTVQRALRELASDGLVVRTQGSGTYVAEGRGSIDEPLHLRFLSGSGSPVFLPLFPKVLERHRISGHGPWSHWLGQTDGDVIRIDRRISVNGEFTLYNRFYFNAATFPGLAKASLASLDGANLKQMLAREINMPVTDVRQCISLIRLPDEAVAAAGVKQGVRGLLLESAAFAGRDPLYYLESYIPPNDRRLDISCPKE
jgi:GntR family transcriptional regulator